jgi:polyhydroxyalkanoate synthesis regulator phasin
MIFFTKKQPKSAPLLIIKKETDEPNVKEYNSIEEAIADLENDPNVSADKIDKLRSALKKLKNKTSIKIKDGKILK